MSIGILPNVNSIKQYRAVKHGTSVCSRIIRLTNNRTKSRKKRLSSLPPLPPPKKKKKRKRRQKCCSYCKNCTIIGLSLARLRIIGISKRRFGESRCKKFWDQFDEYESLSLRYVKQVSGKRRDHCLENYKSKFFISELPTL